MVTATKRDSNCLENQAWATSAGFRGVRCEHGVRDDQHLRMQATMATFFALLARKR
jgi:hypothetical protein